MRTLSSRREKTNVFAGKRSFMTPRDLFRWGERSPESWKQLAEDGFMLLGERLRTDEAKAIVRECLEKECKVKIDENELYSQSAVDSLVQQLLRTMQSEEAFLAEALKANSSASSVAATAAAAKSAADAAAARLDPTSLANASNKEAQQIGKIAWTAGMRRMFIQVGRALLFSEPVLLVGETGCGVSVQSRYNGNTFGIVFQSADVLLCFFAIHRNAGAPAR